MIRSFPGIRALEIFEAAGRHLNFSRAAEEIGLTPAAISYQIKEIEDQIGLVLFVRTSRTMRLTAAGRLLHDAAGEALAALRLATARAKRLARGESQLRVTSDPVFASKWLMPRVESFRKAQPAIELRFDVSSDLRDFDEDDIDIGVRFGAGRYAGLGV